MNDAVLTAIRAAERAVVRPVGSVRSDRSVRSELPCAPCRKKGEALRKAAAVAGATAAPRPPDVRCIWFAVSGLGTVTCWKPTAGAPAMGAARQINAADCQQCGSKQW